MINVEQINENEFTISWDETSPTESILNTWTEDDFIKVIMERIEELNRNEG
jgi:hypothetical protein